MSNSGSGSTWVTGTSSGPTGFAATSSGTVTWPVATTGITMDDPFLTVAHINCPIHRTNPDNIEYMDGKVVTYCLHCDARIEVTRLPGGLNFVHAKELAQRLIVLCGQGELTGEELLELSNLRRDVRAEQEKLSEIAALLRTVEILLDE
jgi:hypothetical protein